MKVTSAVLNALLRTIIVKPEVIVLVHSPSRQSDLVPSVKTIVSHARGRRMTYTSFQTPITRQGLMLANVSDSVMVSVFCYCYVLYLHHMEHVMEIILSTS